jgi:hypothetical protein
MIAFICSVWPSIWGWKAINNHGYIVSWQQRFFQNNTANWGPISDIILNGRLWSWNMCAINKLANPFALMSIWQGTKYHFLVKYSTVMARIPTPPYAPYFLIFTPTLLIDLRDHVLMRYDIIEGFVHICAAALVRMFRLIC